ncbi:N-alpha-acetyltransferase 40 [Euphorbia peplus]|nr:N-alpha-acetyltransferase 40 [Euphorbia peplus]
MESTPLATNLNGSTNSNRSRKNKARKEILEKKKRIDELIKAACAKKDHLASFPSFSSFDKNGLSVVLKSGSGDKLSSSVKHHLQKILKDNMERHYTNEWDTEEKVKRRELATPEARYIFAYEASHNHDASNNDIMLDKESHLSVGFVHFRFTLEEEIPVLYVYEIQLESHVQGRGLGKLLMRLIELIARKNCMSAVILTVQKANVVAMDFYTTKLGYSISSISPSRVDPLMGVGMSYEILCKVFDSEAKATLEL